MHTGWATTPGKTVRTPRTVASRYSHLKRTLANGKKATTLGSSITTTKMSHAAEQSEAPRKPAMENQPADAALAPSRVTWTLYRLSANFRCASAITDCANRLMAAQPGRLEKQTVSATGEVGNVRIVEAGYETDDDEAHAVAEDVLRIVSRGTLANDCAILLRTNALCEYFRAVLKAHSLPVREKAKADLPADWARAKAALALLANPDNDRLAYQAIRLASGQQKADEVKRKALDYYSSINDMALFLKPGMQAVAALDQLAKMNISRESLDRIVRISGFLPRDSDVGALVLAVGRQSDLEDDQGHGVAIRTLHGAKGGEWQAVWLPCWESETLPGSRQDVDIQESRRLAFVGITRARSRLWISWAKRRAQKWGGPKDCTASQFVGDCAKEHVVCYP